MQWNTTVHSCYIQASFSGIQLSTLVTHGLNAVEYNCPVLLRTGLMQWNKTVHCCYVQAYSSGVQLSTVVILALLRKPKQ